MKKIIRCDWANTVSYTHLDVYKRQLYPLASALASYTLSAAKLPKLKTAKEIAIKLLKFFIISH